MKLVKDAGSAWRWFSIQAMALAAAIQAAWAGMPADMAARIPEGAVSALSAAVLVLGIIGRLVDQGSGDD